MTPAEKAAEVIVWNWISKLGSDNDAAHQDITRIIQEAIDEAVDNVYRSEKDDE